MDDGKCPACTKRRLCVPCGDAYYAAWCKRFPLPGRPKTVAQVEKAREAISRTSEGHANG